MAPNDEQHAVAVVVLTGGQSRRMGQHKPSLRIGGRALVARVVDAARPRPTLVVGLPDDVPDGIPVIQEHPAGGGPVAAVGRAVQLLASEAEPPTLVVVLAADLPFVTSDHVDRLTAALRRTPGAELAVTTDADGRANWLCAAWRLGALRGRLAMLGDRLAGGSMRELVGDASVVEVSDPDGAGVDVDTPEQLVAARERADERRS
jgi:molybdopterin-guanine dinucleotide biosynthesis protein A